MMGRDLFVNFILLFLIGLTGAEKWRSDYKFHDKCGAWLKFHDIPMTWNEARLTCHYEGSILASPTTKIIQTMIDIIKYNNIPTRRVYTGIHATFASGHFSSIEGVSLDEIPHHWADGYPNNEENPQDCIGLTIDGTIMNLPCDCKLPFICYKKYENLTSTSCGTIDKEYILDSRTGSCYKFHRYPHSWERGYMICKAEGGHLAIINSEVEAQVMRDIFERYPENSLPPTAYKAGASIGFRDVDEHGEWRTVQGQSLKEAGYDKFAQGQPDDAGSNQKCGYLFRTGLLDDIECDSMLQFICEREPNY